MTDISVPALDIKGLKKTFYSKMGVQRVDAVKPITFQVDQGEIFGLLGPNGAGKTTLIKMMLGIIKPSGGTAKMLGNPVGPAGTRHNVGYLPEHHRFPDYLTAGQFLDIYGQFAEIPADLRKKRIPELLERVRMAEWRTTKIGKYSKGMMQRLGIAQSLMNDPQVVFLDEPTDGVDPVGRVEIRDLLLWMKSEGKTVFLNSHLLSEVEQVCSRVAILKKGELVKQGSVEELTSIERSWQIDCTPIPQETLDFFGPAVTLLPLENTSSDLAAYQVSVNERADLNKVVDQLRSRDIEIENINLKKQSLESYFIDVITN